MAVVSYKDKDAGKKEQVAEMFSSGVGCFNLHSLYHAFRKMKEFAKN